MHDVLAHEYKNKDNYMCACHLVTNIKIKIITCAPVI